MRCAKIFVAFLLFIAACIALAVLPRRLCFDEGESYTFFCGNTSADCKIITTDSNAAICRLALKNVCGESTVYNSLDIQAFLDSVNGEIIFTEELSDSVNYYCTADLPYSVTLYGQEINLHICVKESGVIIASPVIFGGY